MRRWVIVCVAVAVVLVPVGVVALAAGQINYLYAAFGGDSDESDGVESGCLPEGVVPDSSRDDYSDEQLENVAAIIDAGQEHDVPPSGWVVAVATAIQESGLRNIDYGDRDSLGLFQQRPSQGWGSKGEITDPEYAAGKFYDHLKDVSGWKDMSLTHAAQAVQRSAFPEAYAQHERDARYLVSAVADSDCGDDGDDTGGSWLAPVKAECSSPFGKRDGQPHEGVDLAASQGASIKAARAGTVIDAGPASGFGLWVRIKHNDGTITTYGHNHANFVSEGDSVDAGDTIAEVGSRGEATGPHLHFEVTPGDDPVDPEEFYEEHDAPSLC